MINRRSLVKDGQNVPYTAHLEGPAIQWAWLDVGDPYLKASCTTPGFSSPRTILTTQPSPSTMNPKKAVTSYYPCPLKASSIFSPQPPPVPMYYARNPVRLTFEDADWGTLTDDDGSESEQAPSPRPFVPAKPSPHPKPTEMSTRDLQVLGKPLANALCASGAVADAKSSEEELNTDQRQRPGALIWTESESERG